MAGIAGATVPIATRVGDHPKTTACTEQLGGRYAYATLITSDDYFMGLQTMVFTLLQTSTTFPIVVLVTDQVGKTTIENIRRLSRQVQVLKVSAIANPNAEVHMPGWVNSGYTKLHIWNLVDYEKV